MTQELFWNPEGVEQALTEALRTLAEGYPLKEG